MKDVVAADITINHRDIVYTTIKVREQIHDGNCRHGESINDIGRGVQVRNITNQQSLIDSKLWL